MNQRNKNAKICQEGASNERRVASSLVEAIDECRAEGVTPSEDDAVFLILHQLAWLLAGTTWRAGMKHWASGGAPPRTTSTP